MAKKRSVIMLAFLGALSASSCRSRVTNECNDLQSPACRHFKAVAGQSLTENLPPVPGSAPAFAAVSGTALTVTWPSASDDHTPPELLAYSLIYALTDQMTTVEEAEQNANVALDWTVNTLTMRVTNLTKMTTYYWSVIVKDQLDAKALYPWAIQATNDSATSADASPANATSPDASPVNVMSTDASPVNPTTASQVAGDPATVNPTPVLPSPSSNPANPAAEGATFVVTPSATAHLTIESGTARSVASGETVSFTAIPDSGYTLSSAVGGSCPAGTWSGNAYTTGGITTGCTVVFSAIASGGGTSSGGAHTVTPQIDAHLIVSPSSLQTVTAGNKAYFTISPTAGYTYATAVGGTCPPGSWNGSLRMVGSVYATGAITTDCTVRFSAVAL